MSNNEGSFVSGLTVGFLAGAAGYFLFGTEKGKKIIRDLEREWQAAQAADPHLTSLITQEATQRVQSSSLLQTLKELVQKMADDQAESAHSLKSPTRHRKPSPRKPDAKFKGV